MPPISSIDDLRRVAKRKLPRLAYEFVEGAAEDEVTLRANREAFQRVAFRPETLVPVADRDQRTTVVGTEVRSPVLLGPAGLARLVAREGEVAAARAAGRNGSIFVLSTSASCSIEEVAEAATGPLWFQIYLWRDREIVRTLVRRAREAGYGALVVTVDVPVIGKREADLRNGMTLPPRIRWRTAIDTARRPRWLRDLAFGAPITFQNFVEAGRGRKLVSLGRFVNEELVNPSATYDDLAWLRTEWDGPLLVKGTMSAQEALRAVEAGVDGVIVSNHGGRQLDGLPASFGVLPEVVAAVGDRVEVYLDGGVRRGGDVVKAIALGARACFVARPYLYALASGGEAGVDRMFEIFREEIDSTQALIGRQRIVDVDAASLRFRSPAHVHVDHQLGGTAMDGPAGSVRPSRVADGR